MEALRDILALENASHSSKVSLSLSRFHLITLPPPTHKRRSGKLRGQHLRKQQVRGRGRGPQRSCTSTYAYMRLITSSLWYLNPKPS